MAANWLFRPQDMGRRPDKIASIGFGRGGGGPMA